MATFQELLAAAKAAVTEIDAPEAARRRAAGAVLVDVRESDETDSGSIVDSALIPRGMLELQIEQAVPDRETEIVVMCAGGTRSALAAVTLQAMGYTRVVSLCLLYTSPSPRDA